MTLRRGPPPDPPSVEEGPAPEEPPRPELPPDKFVQTKPLNRLLTSEMGANAYNIFRNNQVAAPILRGKSADVLLAPENGLETPTIPKTSGNPAIRRRMAIELDPGTSPRDVQIGDYWESILGTDKPGRVIMKRR